MNELLSCFSLPILRTAHAACDLSIGSYTITNNLDKFCDVSDIINKLLPYIFTLSGILLFIFLLASGFDLLTSGGDEKRLNQAKGRITNALLGFIIIIAAYWITQIAEFLLHIKVF
jgi:hypothetical protein